MASLTARINYVKAKADISYVKVAADITYQKIAAIPLADYHSINQRFLESVEVTESISFVYSNNGMFNGATFNSIPVLPQ